VAGTRAVSFVAAIGASLTLGLRRSGLLLALLVLPLYVPVLGDKRFNLVRSR
jgi:heme exporter protein B